MAQARIYDAEFSPGTQGTHHAHLGKFWWVDTSGKTDTWTRQQAYDYVRNNPGDIHVVEDRRRVLVKSYHDAQGTVWIQTEADGIKRDNLLTLAKRHAQGLVNN